MVFSGWQQPTTQTSSQQQKPDEKSSQSVFDKPKTYKSVIGDRSDRGLNKAFGE